MVTEKATGQVKRGEIREVEQTVDAQLALDLRDRTLDQGLGLGIADPVDQETAGGTDRQIGGTGAHLLDGLGLLLRDALDGELGPALDGEIIVGPHLLFEAPLLRLSVGLEHPDDLIADLEAGFARLA